MRRGSAGKAAAAETPGRAPGVLPFRERGGRPAVAPPGYVKPAEQPGRRTAAANPPLPAELNELEVPTFIRRQMDCCRRPGGRATPISPACWVPAALAVA